RLQRGSEPNSTVPSRGGEAGARSKCLDQQRGGGGGGEDRVGDGDVRVQYLQGLRGVCADGAADGGPARRRGAAQALIRRRLPDPSLDGVVEQLGARP